MKLSITVKIIYNKIVAPYFGSLVISKVLMQRTPHSFTGMHRDSRVSINLNFLGCTYLNRNQ